MTFQTLLGHCIRKYEGGCSNSKDLLLKSHIGEFTLHDCYQLCLARLDLGCDGFSLQKDGRTCQLFKKGCQKIIDDPPMWDFYEMKDCPGIVECQYVLRITIFLHKYTRGLYNTLIFRRRVSSNKKKFVVLRERLDASTGCS